jgi:hypothetical protein
MKYTAEMGSGAMIHTESFIRLVQAIIVDQGGGGEDTITQETQHGDLVSLYFLEMKLPYNSHNTSALTMNIFTSLRTAVSELSSLGPS